jgi:DNA polymerase elongation subunit (family B)
MKLPVQNIDSVYSNIYLFQRNPKTKKLEITTENYIPYYYKKDETGSYTTYQKNRASRINGDLPKDKKFLKDVYETDVPIVKKYILDKDIEFIPSPLRYMFFDIEVFCPTGTSVKNFTGYVSSITVKDSYAPTAEQFYLGDYLIGENYEEAEKKLVFNFAKYVKETQPDMLLAWYVEFDWSYLCNRFPNLPELLSPVDKDRFWSGESTAKAPVGISIVDYLTLFKKVNMRESSYKLDEICIKYLKAGKVNKDIDFDVLSQVLKDRNFEDVVLLNELEEKFRLLPYYDEIRRLARVRWEELYHNSKPIEMLCLTEAKKMRIVLPNKTGSNIKTTFQGATRGLEEPGVFHKIGKYDLSGAYPAAIINFCLDEMNICSALTDAIKIDGVYYKQNPDALIPLVAKKMVTLKENIGKQLAQINEHDVHYTRLKNQYNGIKGIVNSTFGVLGNQYFRLYNPNIVSAITFLIRDLLDYVREELKLRGYRSIYFDTDSIFIEHEGNIVDEMNELIQEWGRLKYNKDQVNLNFAYEGHFKDLLILGTCHYYGVKDKVGAKPEIKGIEMKRCSSTKFEAQFQEALIKRVLQGDTQKDVEKWIETQKEGIKKELPSNFCFPCKVSMDKVYKNRPVFLRAIDNSVLFDKKFSVKTGDNFFYVYVDKVRDTAGKAIKDINNKHIDVIAFKDDDCNLFTLFKDKIDWDRVIDRNIGSKAEKIFEVLKWKTAVTKPLGLLANIESIEEVKTEHPILKKVKTVKANIDSIF